MHALSVIKNIDKKNKVLFVIMFGSQAKGNYTRLSDTDIAIFYEGSNLERYKFRIKASGELPDKYDVNILQDLPMHIQQEVIKTGKTIYSRDEKKTIEEFIKIVREKPRTERLMRPYYEKLERDANART